MTEPLLPLEILIAVTRSNGPSGPLAGATDKLPVLSAATGELTTVGSLAVSSRSIAKPATSASSMRRISSDSNEKARRDPF